MLKYKQKQNITGENWIPQKCASPFDCLPADSHTSAIFLWNFCLKKASVSEIIFLNLFCKLEIKK